MNFLKFLLKLFIVMLIYLLLYSFIYAIILSKSLNNINIIVSLISSSFAYTILCFMYANHFKKRGLVIGIIITIIHILIIKSLLYINSNTFNINALKVSIQIIMGGIGGLLGTNVKKIF